VTDAEPGGAHLHTRARLGDTTHMGTTARTQEADPAAAIALGARLRSAREAAGLTRLRVAVPLGIDPATVQRWENGGSVPTFDVLVALADLLGVELDELGDIFRECPRWDSNPRSSDYKIAGRLADVVELDRGRRPGAAGGDVVAMPRRARNT